MREINWQDIERRSDGSISAVHRIRFKSGYSFPLHKHRGFHEIVTCLNGGLTHTAPGRVVKQEAGDVLLIRDGDCHAISGRLGEFINIVLPNTWLKDMYIEDFGGLPEDVQVNLSQAEKELLISGYEDYAASADPNLKRIRYTRLALWIVELLIAAGGVPGRMRAGELKGRTPAWLYAAVRRLDSGTWKIQSPGELAEACGVSPEHLSRCWKKNTGMTPSGYLLRLRLDRALGMLKTSNMSVTHIALQNGFQSLNYFFVKFRKTYGVSPGAYKKNLKEKMPT